MAENLSPTPEATPPAGQPPAGTGEPAARKKRPSPFLLIGAVVLFVSLLILIGLAFLPASFLARARDVAIVFLVLLIFLLLLLLLYLTAVLIYALNRLGVRLDALLQQGDALLEQVKGTAHTVKGTADFVGERVASPLIGIASWGVGVGAGLRTLFRKKREEQKEVEP